MSGGPIIAGPFVGGINTLADAANIADTEMATCDNFEVDADGSLKTRPPFVDRSITLPLSTSGEPRFLGYYTRTDGTQQLIASDGNTSTYAFNGATWALITNTVSAVGMVQFNGQLHLLASPTQGTGGRWDGTTWTADANMPKGESIVAYKARLWIAAGRSSGNPTRIWFSAVLGNTLWTTGNSFFELNAGDGQANVALMVLNSNILVFRTSSIWVFSYSTDPTYGQQNMVIADVGLADARAIEVFSGTVYFMFNGRAYTYSGGQVQQINPKVPFISSQRANCVAPFNVSVFNKRIFFSFYNVLYVFNTVSRTWTTWSVPTYTGIGKIVAYQGPLASDLPVAVAISNFANTGGTRAAKILFLTDGNTSEKEANTYVCTMQTKTFDFGSPTNYKRLFWWGANVIVRGPLLATVMPVVYAVPVTWGQLRLAGRTWGQSLLYTWAAPAAGDLSAQTQITSTNSAFGPQAKFLRFLQNRRFRRAYFRMVLTIDGSTDTAPGRIFNLIPFLTVKERVSQQVT